MYNNIKNHIVSKKHKKRGFTIIELIAVMAIIAILAVVVTPKIGGYIEEARKTKAVAQVREVVMAVESYNIKASDAIENDDEYSAFKTNLINSGYLKLAKDADGNYIDIVNDSLSYGEIKGIIEGSKQFKIEGQKVSAIE